MQIVKAVIMHEAALKAQAKKMNVESLRAGDQSGESAEVKIAKVRTYNGRVTRDCQTLVFIIQGGHAVGEVTMCTHAD